MTAEPINRSEQTIELMPTTWKIKPGSLEYPLVIAHRGDHTSVPENTIPAFRRALETGADAVELDVHLSKDGQVVVFHDRTLDRMTNGQGSLSLRTFKELRSLAVLSPDGNEDKVGQIPTLDEVFEALPLTYLVCVELKARIAGMRDLPLRTGEVIRRHQRWETTMVHSFNPVSLFHLRRLEPRIAVGFIWSRRHPYPLRARWLSPLANPHWLAPAEYTFNSKVLAHFHAQGKSVLAWDVDAGTDMENLRRMGLDAVVTNHPARLISQRASRTPESYETR